ncbi:hypothetical protein Sjap_006732 [Stephania japonica]|uniref:Uncharacterized protein n=1 Tax=Stephania japonica TaxID=461633 RepID=A0AAP0PLB9_9MAGN
MNLTEQELDQWIEQRDQEAEEEIKSILQKISAETMSVIPLESVEVNEVTPIEDYWSKPEEIIEVSLHEPDISIAQNETDEAEKEIDVILERPEELQKESKEDQPLVLVKPPTLPCIFVRPYKGVVIKERSHIFYTADTFVSVDHNLIDSYVLEVPDELLHLKEGMYDELPKSIDASFVVDISKERASRDHSRQGLRARHVAAGRREGVAQFLPKIWETAHARIPMQIDELERGDSLRDDVAVAGWLRCCCFGDVARVDWCWRCWTDDVAFSYWLNWPVRRGLANLLLTCGTATPITSLSV